MVPPSGAMAYLRGTQEGARVEPRPTRPIPETIVPAAQEYDGVVLSPFRLVMLGTVANVILQDGALIEAELRKAGWKRDWRVVAATNAAESIRWIEQSLTPEEQGVLPTDEATLAMLAQDMMLLN